jgi:hypothetical protein
MRFKIVFHINRFVAVHQVTDVAHAGFYHKAFSEVFFDGFGLGRGLNNDEIFYFVHEAAREKLTAKQRQRIAD